MTVNFRFMSVAMVLCAGTAGSAGCAPPLKEFLYCQIKGGQKEVEVCFDDDAASYRFGLIGGRPELLLNRRIPEGARYYPWQGVGRSIAEAIEFDNQGYVYEAYGGFDRLTGADESIEASFGGIRITKDGSKVTELVCIPETVQWSY